MVVLTHSIVKGVLHRIVLIPTGGQYDLRNKKHIYIYIYIYIFEKILAEVSLINLCGKQIMLDLPTYSTPSNQTEVYMLQKP